MPQLFRDISPPRHSTGWGSTKELWGENNPPVGSHALHPPSPSTQAVIVGTWRGKAKPSLNEHNPWHYHTFWNNFVQHCQQKHEPCLKSLLLFLSTIKTSTAASDLNSISGSIQERGVLPRWPNFQLISCLSTVSAEENLEINFAVAEMKDTRKGSSQVSRMAVFEQYQGQ